MVHVVIHRLVLLVRSYEHPYYLLNFIQLLLTLELIELLFEGEKDAFVVGDFLECLLVPSNYVLNSVLEDWIDIHNLISVEASLSALLEPLVVILVVQLLQLYFVLLFLYLIHCLKVFYQLELLQSTFLFRLDVFQVL